MDYSDEEKYWKELNKPAEKKKNPLKYIIPIIIILFVFIVFLKISNTPEPSGETDFNINLNNTPTQINFSNISDSDQIQIKKGDYVFNLTPVARYNISALIVSKKHYRLYDDCGERASLIDLCLTWGHMAEPPYSNPKSFRQLDRRCDYNPDPEAKLSTKYSVSHFSNNNIIPASKNILKAVDSLSVGDKVFLEGFLVNVKEDSCVGLWSTSLTRSDESLSESEIFYVDKIIYKNKIYK